MKKIGPNALVEALRELGLEIVKTTNTRANLGKRAELVACEHFNITPAEPHNRWTTLPREAPKLIKHRDQAAIGDPVEVRFVRPPIGVVLGLPVGEPLNRPEVEIVWTPGTICSVSDRKIIVAFADRTRMEIARYSGAWRMT
jgi:hypothetical protein